MVFNSFGLLVHVGAVARTTFVAAANHSGVRACMRLDNVRMWTPKQWRAVL